MTVENRTMKNCDSGRITDYQMQQVQFPLWNFYQKMTSFKIFFYQRLSSIIGHLPLKVVFHKRLFPSKVVFYQRSSSIIGHLPSKFIYLPSKAFFHLRLSLIKGENTSLKKVHQKKANHMKDQSVQPNPLN